MSKNYFLTTKNVSNNTTFTDLKAVECLIFFPLCHYQACASQMQTEMILSQSIRPFSSYSELSGLGESIRNISSNLLPRLYHRCLKYFV